MGEDGGRWGRVREGGGGRGKEERGEGGEEGMGW